MSHLFADVQCSLLILPFRVQLHFSFSIFIELCLMPFRLGAVCLGGLQNTLYNILKHLSSRSIPPGKVRLSQRTAGSGAGLAPPPGTWRPGPLRPAGRGRSCKRPTATRWGSRWPAAWHSTPCCPGPTGGTSDRHRAEPPRDQVELSVTRHFSAAPIFLFHYY